jgi:arylsulfatase A-like enzyme
MNRVAPPVPAAPEADGSGYTIENRLGGTAAPRYRKWQIDTVRPYCGRTVLEVGPGMGVLTRALADRAQRVVAVEIDRGMVGALRDTLSKAGVAGTTVIVFSSDNGFHMGEHRLRPGKQTAFDTDIRVPLIMAGRGIRSGATVTQPAENIDLRPTFDDLAGAATPSDVDGRSLLPLLVGPPPADWRTAALIEHHGPDLQRADPDYPAPFSGNPTSYAAVRTVRYTYVEYADGFREYYDHATDPDQLHNVAAGLPKAVADRLHRQVAALRSCHGAAACSAAGR